MVVVWVVVAAAVATLAVALTVRRRPPETDAPPVPAPTSIAPQSVPTPVTPQPYADGTGEEQIVALARAGRKVEAIKLLRARTGMSLRDAKAWVNARS